MRATILAVTGKQPAWLVDAIEEYAKRLRPRIRTDLIDLKAESRSAGRTTEAILQAEADRIRARLPQPCRLIALDERGELWSTQKLSREIADWKRTGEHVVFLIGGPDGLDPGFREAIRLQLALSRFTLPHGLAKLLLVEQLYRASSLLDGHPYHRE